ncbi:serine protease [Roseomonas eburnea]|uniref:Serine protease n=1 Tax=Neoroseomonas eburnea TaxID=1346889 RepID=A0A9X9X6G7_9PROT|nr:S1C family serine protease [Neoroseomonas eburnea]MBR0679303.1 serine protease [Neoroseomonas eburnea]
MAKDDWDVPEHLQPDPTDFSFDLDAALGRVVGLRSQVPADAYTARVLGTDREGSGVVIRDGLVLTVGYLVTEAESIWITAADGRAVPGHTLAVDQETGFGLVQALGKLGIAPMELGDSEALRIGAPVVLAAAGGRPHAVSAKLVARQPFAGYWEYLLEDALFTAPAHPSWGGAGLIGPDGKLMGIGSLILQQGEEGRRLDLNMVVPVHRLSPILNDLLTLGRVNRPARPWLGLYATEDEEGVAVASLAPGGPAENSGVRSGDRVLSVGGAAVTDLAELWRAVWSAGDAGATVKLKLGRARGSRDVSVVSSDRSSFLKHPRLH